MTMYLGFADLILNSKMAGCVCSLENKIKLKTGNSPNKKDKSFCNEVVVIIERWFSEMNLTDGATFPLALIKC